MTSMQIVQLIFKGLFSSNTLLFQVNQPLFQLTFFPQWALQQSPSIFQLSFLVQNAHVVANCCGHQPGHKARDWGRASCSATATF